MDQSPAPLEVSLPVRQRATVASAPSGRLGKEQREIVESLPANRHLTLEVHRSATDVFPHGQTAAH